MRCFFHGPFAVAVWPLPFALFACLAFAGQPSPGGESMNSDDSTVMVGDADSGKTVELSRNGKLVVRLAVQLGTGYSYQVAKIDNNLLVPVGAPTIEDGEDLPGGREFQVFRFRAVGSGTVDLRLHYRRPFDPPETPPAKVFTLEVACGE